MPVSGTITQASLATFFDGFRTRINASKQYSPKDWWVHARGFDVNNSETADVFFTPDDDCELRMIRLKTVCAAAVVASVTLIAVDANGTDVSDDYLQGEDVSLEQSVAVTTRSSDATPFAAANGRSRYIRLLRGVTYRLRVTNTAANNAPLIEGSIQLRSWRRRR